MVPDDSDINTSEATWLPRFHGAHSSFVCRVTGARRQEGRLLAR